MKERLIVLFFIALALIQFSSASIQDVIPIQIQTTDNDGNIISGTFEFTINISNSSNCDEVIYSNTTVLSTDSRGIVSYNLENVNLTFDYQYYLCYYRDGVLKQNLAAGRTPYAFNSKFANNSVFLNGYNASFFAPLNNSINTLGLNPLSEAPINPTQGMLFYNSTSNIPMFYNGSLWIEMGIVPQGTISAFNRETCPQGWIEYTGLQGRVIIGSGNGTDINSLQKNFTLQENGGEYNHTLTINEMPSHTHNIGTADTLSGGGQNAESDSSPYSYNRVTSATGGGASHNIVQPYHVLKFCEKIGTDFSEGTLSLFGTGGSDVFLQNTAYELGIGTTSPLAKLHVIGSSIITGDLTVDTNTLFVDSINNRIGIGISSPLSTLHIIGNSILQGNTNITGNVSISGNITQVDNINSTGNITTNWVKSKNKIYIAPNIGQYNANVAQGSVGNSASAQFADAASGIWRTQVQIPVGATSIDSIKIFSWNAVASVNLRLEFVSDSYLNNGTRLSNTLAEASYATSSTTSIKQDFSLSSSLWSNLTLQEGNLFSLEITRNGASGSDTYNAAWESLGVEIVFS